ncbi:MAG: endonuclease/exonuclease/phosphatase family protein [Pyramidobacter sp.]|nr:endonuclease/exonuclease/phosphatase family protein [Pyramidobacter sp.]
MKRFLRGVLAAVIVCVLAAHAWALALGTFNIEYFTVEGKKRYVPSDCEYLAETIRRSGADVLALQEISGNSAMRYFVMNHLRGWKYAGNDTGSRQDVYFLWNPEKVTMMGDAEVYFSNASGRYNGKSFKLFDRPLLLGRFKDNETGRVYTLINVHLKSMSTRGKKDQDEAVRYNDAKRAAQTKKLNELVRSLRGPVFILGDYNDTEPKGTDFPLLGLKQGYSYDNKKSNLDYIGYTGIEKEEHWNVYEVETRIPRRSTKKTQHPDHDIIVLDIGSR